MPTRRNSSTLAMTATSPNSDASSSSSRSLSSSSTSSSSSSSSSSFPEQWQAAKSLLDEASETRSVDEAERCLVTATAMLELNASKFDAMVRSKHKNKQKQSQIENPFVCLLPSARRRLGQIHLSRGRYTEASELFLKIVRSSPPNKYVSHTILATIWYDLAILEHSHFSRTRNAQQYLVRSWTLLRRKRMLGISWDAADSRLARFVRHAMMKLNVIISNETHVGQDNVEEEEEVLPWSYQFSHATSQRILIQQQRSIQSSVVMRSVQATPTFTAEAA